MLHKDDLIDRILEHLKDASEGELRVVLAFIRSLTRK